MGKKKAPAQAEGIQATAEPVDNKTDEPADIKDPAGEQEPKAEAADAEEDTPVVKTLKELDLKYLEIKKRFDAEVEELRKKYAEEQAPILADRTKVLAAAPAEGESVGGTPAVKEFWLQAMKNHPCFEDQIETWDEPVLEYLSDISVSHNPAGASKGFKLEFHFAENPYFTNEVLWKDFRLDEANPYTGEEKALEITANSIEWKEGKNVTVELVKKKQKGGGAKKKAPKAKEEPRDSFFRVFFRHLKKDGPVPDDLNLSEARQLCGASDEEEGDSEMMGLIMENDLAIGSAIRDQLIPYAVRWYTGEAAPEDDDDSDDDDDEDEDGDEVDSDEDEEDDDSDSEAAPAPSKGKKPQAKKRGGGRGSGPTVGSAEDCKQQ